MVEMKIMSSREEWLANRQRIGGSDAAAIIGKNPYRSNVDLWKIKTGQMEAEDISQKPYVLYGTLAEPHIRALFALDYQEYKVEYEENNMFLNSCYPFAHASLDGWLTEIATGRKGILEIKTTTILNSLQQDKWRDQIPDNYYIQVLHYLMVTGFEFAELVALLRYTNMDIPEQIRHYHIERSDVTEDIEYLIDAERRFWWQVENKKEPAVILPDI